MNSTREASPSIMVPPTPIKLDCTKLREERQKVNNATVFSLIKSRNIPELKKNINIKELDRLLLETGQTEDQFINKCVEDDIHNLTVSGRISKNASRQGAQDEATQIQACNCTSQLLGISIENLSATAYRPTKNGKIISQTEMKEQKIPKDECLKSFDGKISGRMNGWMFAKVRVGEGGHQDNVFEEIDAMCKWVKEYNNKDMFVMLIDTDSIDKLNIYKQKYKSVKNILFVNHCEFQQYMIDNYYVPQTLSSK
jgi:hypothetical protein